MGVKLLDCEGVSLNDWRLIEKLSLEIFISSIFQTVFVFWESLLGED